MQIRWATDTSQTDSAMSQPSSSHASTIRLRNLIITVARPHKLTNTDHLLTQMLVGCGHTWSVAVVIAWTTGECFVLLLCGTYVTFGDRQSCVWVKVSSQKMLRFYYGRNKKFVASFSRKGFEEWLSGVLQNLGTELDIGVNSRIRRGHIWKSQRRIT